MFKAIRSLKSTLGRMYSTFPATTQDPRHKAWRKEYFREMWRIEWKLLKLSPVFNLFFPKEKQRNRKISRMFYCMHHPLSGTRQLAEWRRLGPENTPPGVRDSISRMSKATRSLRVKS